MGEKSIIDFEKLLNSLSSIITYKILKLYNSEKMKGYSLTETARIINESVSTVQDNLKKLLTSNLIYKKNKTYFLSTFGSYYVEELQNFKNLNKLGHIFGRIPAEFIPSRFFKDLIPYVKNLEIQEGSWHFINGWRYFLDQFEKIFDKDNQDSLDFKILGLWPKSMDIKMLGTYFKEITFDSNTIKRFFQKANFKLILDRNLVKAMLENKQIRDLMLLKTLNLHGKIRVYEKINKFNFTLMKNNHNIGLFLIKKNDIDMNHHLFIKNNPGMEKFFDKVFNYYWEQSILLNQFLDDM